MHQVGDALTRSFVLAAAAFLDDLWSGDDWSGLRNGVHPLLLEGKALPAAEGR